jgi:predicted Zn-dependent peptidase
MAQRAKFLFNSFKGSELQKRVLPEPPAAPTEPVYSESTGPVGGAVIMLGFPSPSAHEEGDVYGMDVLSFILGQGKHSKLHRQLVDQEEIASSVSANYLTPRQRGLLIVSAVGETEDATKIRTSILAQIDDIKAGNFTEDDMKRAKAQLLQSYLQGNETNSGKADTIGFYSALGVPDFWKTYPKEIESVRKEDVIDVAKRYLGGGHWGHTLKPSRGGR